ncbi:hypothetical protein [Caldivirga sp. MU80]|uniref:hypothetical protein n=1 Tax=Caldivirga sp. MU80 TaxID=1650354 RepID=UPI0013900D66|nr:hypothetical protein [Caldivirga sp. MU80]
MSKVVVRVRVRLINESTGRSSEIIVLVNGGAESEVPVIAVTPSIARDIGLSIDDMDLIEVELASGVTHNYISRNTVLAQLLDDVGRVLSQARVYIAVDENLTEPLMTDITIDELGIQVISFSRGLWRHVNDPPNVVRKSATRY